MTNLIFVSHATQDIEQVTQLCDALENTGVELWVSYRDIAPGEDWQRAIEDKMEAATHVVVAVTANCIDSDYVRAEVDYALTDGKVVIPVMLESDIRIPLRWRAVQHVDWSSRSEATLLQLARSLPRASLAKLKLYLDSPRRAKDLHNLLYQYPHWFHAEARQRKEWGYVAGKSDFFHMVKETGKSSKYFFYLGSPYEAPFQANGQPSQTMKKVLQQAMKDARPGNQTAELGQNIVYLQVYAGQRRLYSPETLEKRNMLQEVIPRRILNSLPPHQQARARVQLEIASYTRLLERLRRRSGGNSR